MTDAVEVRRARAEDREAVVAFTADTWPDRGAGDYIQHVFDDWIAGDGDDQRTFVLDVEGEVAGICQGVLLSPTEAWAQGMRVNPDFRGRGVSVDLTRAVFDWAAAAGATVCRNMVFSWNVAGLGQSRAAGFEPETEFRWVHPEPDVDATPDHGDHRVVADADAAWTYWTDSPAREHLHGLGLDPDESWALSEVTRERLRRAADDGGLFAVQGGDDGGTRAMAYRSRTYERPNEAGEAETWAEYGVGAWATHDHARALFAAVAADAAALGADRTRVLVPETVEAVSDAAYARVAVSDEPDFVLAADLTTR
ncbi:GNAT family N-acetyltransferase [Halomarina pelagica]|uniref:GNAT family N-acetyltransferase n=1 Tax=Halomarina pelagica TaxID=2961599 RepID=UPI0020C59477|nr:GNAT family N-acetyltransferase [Halomarina sp. BND7]